MEDLPVRKAAMVVWGLPGVVAGVAGLIAAPWLSGEYDEHLVRLIELLVVPCAVLIGAAIVAITFAADWEMTPEQARRRDELVISAGILSVFAVFAIMAAGLYVALAPASGGSIPTGAENVETVGTVAAALLGLSVGGLVTHLFQLVRLVRYRTGAITDD